MKKILLILVFLYSSTFLVTSEAKAQDALSNKITNQNAEKEKPAELSLNTVVLFALDENPDIEIATEKEEQMKYYVEEGRSAFYPQVEMKVEGGREFISPASGPTTNEMAKSTLSLNQKLYDGYATQSEVRRRDELKNASHHEKVKQTEDVTLNAVQYYLSILRYQNVVATTGLFLNEMDDIIKTASNMYEAGALSKVMMDYALSRQASAKIDMNEAMSSLNDARSNLIFLTGPLPEFVAIEPDMLRPDMLDVDFYLKLAQDQNSDILKNRSELQAMEYQLDQENAAYMPEVDLRFKMEQKHNDGGAVGTANNVKATINVKYNLFDGFNKNNRVKRVKSQIRELDQKDLKIYKQLSKDISLSYNQIRSLRESIRVTEAEIESSKAVQILNRQNFELGETTVIELIEGEERLNAAYARKYKIKEEMYKNIYSLLLKTKALQQEYFCTTCVPESNS